MTAKKRSKASKSKSAGKRKSTAKKKAAATRKSGARAKKKATKKKATKKKAAKKKSATRSTGRKRSTAKKKTTRRKAAKKSRSRKKSAESEVAELQDLPEDALVCLAIRGMVLFPGVVLPVVIGREASVRAVQAAVQAGASIGLLLQKDPEDDDPDPSELHTIGTAADIVRYLTAPDGTHHAIVQGQERFRTIEVLSTSPFLVVRAERLPEPTFDELPTEIAARFMHLRQQATEAIDLLPEKPEDLEAAVNNAPSPAILADLVATFMDLPVEEKQEILESVDLEPRMALVSEKLAGLVEVLRLSSDMREATKETLEKGQREYFLREQLRTIQKELGEGEAVEIQDLREQIEKSGMTDQVRKEATKELARLERMPEAAAEHGMVRTYLEWLLELPWNELSTDSIDIKSARVILDEDHYGLEKVKRRIVEFLAVRKLAPDGKSPILVLVGPPGVGKTSLGQSVARAMGRKFVRISLGGVHDESEIRGHRRTYVGSMPGAIIQQIRKAGTRNPVFMLDEMDKLGTGFHGDPASALLEVLDPEQNREFVDHYLNVPFDLSRVLFIATANVIDQIPGPLRDRCEVIELPGYTEEEKLQIAKRYLVARRREANGLKPRQITLKDDALTEIIRSYTREAGCRSLEREIGAVVRAVATRIAAGEIKSKTVRAADVNEILGAPRFESELAMRTSVPGVATGLAWTPVGGELLFVEVSSMPGKGELILTGQLGDVMKESARAAITLVKSRADDLGIPSEAFEKTDLHIHVPAGAIPKDGPSAGVAIFTALVSLLTKRTVKSDIAMTGEISLRGLVLPVGGIKEKVLAAHRAGIRRVLLPSKNKKDEEDIPEGARKALKLTYLDKVEDALEVALERRRPKASESRSSSGSSGRLSARS